MRSKTSFSNKTMLSIGTIVVALLFLLSLFMGGAASQLSHVAQHGEVDAEIMSLILFEIRLPRALIALIVGATFGLCGAAMQSLLRNPLATPGLVGSSSGAALGAVLVFYFGSGTINWIIMPLAGTGGSLLAIAFVYLLAGRDSSIVTLILAGVAVNSVALSMLSLILNLAPSPYAVQEIVLWMLGSIANRSMQDFYLLLPGTILGWLLLAKTGHALNALSLGEDTAATMGINVGKLRWRIFIAISLAVGAAVSTTGSIGFIGLVVPHMLRPFVNYEPSRLLPLSALGGAALLLAADVIVRLFPAGVDIKVGVITSIIGAPFFLYLIVSTRRTNL